MRWFPRGMWRYAVLIVLLLTLAGYASWRTIESISEFVKDIGEDAGHPVSDPLLLRIITIPILALTMGFLFLAGGLGIWMIRSIAQIESRQRIGRFVDAMDYLKDGLVALDRKGRVTGMNPTARSLVAGEVQPRAELKELFPYLSVEDESRLVDTTSPQEVECVSRAEGGLRALRFRSQPSEDINLILVSDITGLKAQEMRHRQVARLQLIGRISRGVAHDFNNILCAITGYAALLERQGPAEKDNASLKSILRESQRGAALASQLLDLSRTGVKGNPCISLAEHVDQAAGLLRVGLSAEWQVVGDVQGTFDAVPLTDVQVEQAVVNLGLLAADELGKPGFVHIRARPPGRENLFDVGDEFAAVVLISAYGSQPDLPEVVPAARPESLTTAVEAGVVQSVVRSMLEEVGGRLDILVAPGSRHSYRLCVPQLMVSESKMSALAAVPEDLRTSLLSWHVLVARPVGGNNRIGLEQRLKDLGMSVESAGDIVSALQQVEAARELSAVIFDRKLLGEEGDALLRAILKLRPHAGLVVLHESTDAIPQNLKADVVFEPVDASVDSIVQALVRARDIALARKRA